MNYKLSIRIKIHNLEITPKETTIINNQHGGTHLGGIA